jgi:hypothetical protein
MDSPDRQARDEPQLELPDLDVIVRSYQAITAELPKFRNIPAFDVGAGILTEMRAMREEMRAMREEMRAMREENREMRLEMRRGNDRLDGRFKAMYVTLPSFLLPTTSFAAAGARERTVLMRVSSSQGSQ